MLWGRKKAEDVPVDRRLDVLRGAVEADITLAWTRKTSFETRALALITANFAMATVFFLINRELGYTSISQNGFSRGALVTALVGSAISVIASCLTAMLYNYKVMPVATYDRALNEVSQADIDVVVDVVDMRIGLYETARHANGRKATFLAIAMSAFAAASLAYILAIVSSVL